MHDRVIGSIALVFLLAFYLYYSIWLLVLPFLEPSTNHVHVPSSPLPLHLHLHSFFPPLDYIALLPVFIIVTVVAILNSVIAIVFIKQDTPSLLVVDSR